MSPTKKTLLVVSTVLIAIQFIQPAHNKNEQVLQTDFAKVFAVPNNVQSLLKRACYDCHSNNTNYPWYSNIQPFAWIMASHIKNGKENINFSDFGSYTNRRQISKLKEVANQIKDDEMPIVSYKMMHKNSRLTKAEKTMVLSWINKITDSLTANQ